MASEWISVNVRLPEEGVEVLLYYSDLYGIDLGSWNGLKYSNGGWHTWKHGWSQIKTEWVTGKPGKKCIKGEQPTHWMPLPEPPEANL